MAVMLLGDGGTWDFAYLDRAGGTAARTPAGTLNRPGRGKLGQGETVTVDEQEAVMIDGIPYLYPRPALDPRTMRLTRRGFPDELRPDPIVCDRCGHRPNVTLGKLRRDVSAALGRGLVEIFA